MSLLASELRIGNFVKDRYDLTKPILIESIDQKGINISAGDDGKPYGMHIPQIDYEFFLSEINGIELTEDWLLRMGFDKFSDFKSGSFSWYLGGAKEFRIEKEDDTTWYLDGYSHTSKVINHVHQIQNLYFALTGLELEIKP